jgi:hypothetical protein
MFTLRFDMRAPSWAAPAADLYAAAIDMCAWAETRGAGAEDGPYCIFTSDEATEYVRGGRLLPLHPLCGGVPPDVAWPCLERAAAAAARAHE